MLLDFIEFILAFLKLILFYIGPIVLLINIYKYFR